MMTETSNAFNHWTEENSATFLDTANLFVPGRAEQIASLVSLVPADQNESFTVVELGAGEGKLASAILGTYPRCRYLALDGSDLMRERMHVQLAHVADRLTLVPFDIAEREWRETLPSPLRLVVSSLCVHHLSGEEKRVLFTDIASRLEPGGALLLADIVEPVSQRAANMFARQYDDAVRSNSLALYGDLRGFDEFQRLRWNYFTHNYGIPDLDDIDQPSRLGEQLVWMREAGLTDVDCFWMQAGHAVFGGVKPRI